MIVAVARMRMVKMPLDEIVDVLAVRNSFMPTVG